MRLRVLPLTLATVLGLSATAQAADFSDPTWPCVQRKVERLSIGLMWPAELAKLKLSPETGKAVDELAELLVLRRVDMDEAREAVTAFARAHGSGMPLMGKVFETVFEKVSRRRTRIIDGIGKFSLNQIALSERIDEARVEMEQVMAADEPDYDRADTLEEQLDWDQRIYTDRQKTITYLCETPTLLEKRLYSIAQILQEAAGS